VQGPGPRPQGHVRGGQGATGVCLHATVRHTTLGLPTTAIDLLQVTGTSGMCACMAADARQAVVPMLTA
jgi:hypothetical protein